MSEILQNNQSSFEKTIINELIDKKFISHFIDFINKNNLENDFFEILNFISKAKREDIILNSANFLYKISIYFSIEANRELFKLFLVNENNLINEDNLNNEDMNFYLKILSDIDKFYSWKNIYNSSIYKNIKIEPVNNIWYTILENTKIKIQDYISKILILNSLDVILFNVWDSEYKLFKSDEFIYGNNLENISLLDLIWVLNINQESRKKIEIVVSKFQSYKITNIYEIFDISWKKIMFLEFLDWSSKIKAIIDAFWNLLEMKWIFDLENFRLEKVQIWRDIFLKLDWKWIIDKDFKLLEYNNIKIYTILEQTLNWKKYLLNWKELLDWEKFEKYLINNYIAFNTSDIELETIFE